MARGEVDREVREKELEELLAGGRRLLVVAIRKLLEKISSGEATAADMNAAARLIDLLGLDRLLDLRADEHAREIERELEALDAEAEEHDRERTPSRTPFDWKS